MKIFVIAVVLLTCGSAPWGAKRAGAQGVDSCLRLLCANGQTMGGDSGRCINPDSVMIDTCPNSLTYGEEYGFRWWEIHFQYYVINVPAAPADTILEMPWTAIDTSYHALRGAFAKLESRYGTLTLKKVNPSYADSTDVASNVYYIRFNNYVCVDSVTNDLRNFPQLSYSGFRSYPVTLDSGGNASVSDIRSGERNQKILLNPNPAFSSLCVTMNSGSDLGIVTIYDASGKKVFEKIGIENSTFHLDIRFLSDGTYFISSNGINVKLIIAR